MPPYSTTRYPHTWIYQRIHSARRNPDKNPSSSTLIKQNSRPTIPTAIKIQLPLSPKFPPLRLSNSFGIPPLLQRRGSSNHSTIVLFFVFRSPVHRHQLDAFLITIEIIKCHPRYFLWPCRTSISAATTLKLSRNVLATIHNAMKETANSMRTGLVAAPTPTTSPRLNVTRRNSPIYALFGLNWMGIVVDVDIFGIPRFVANSSIYLSLERTRLVVRHPPHGDRGRAPPVIASNPEETSPERSYYWKWLADFQFLVSTGLLLLHRARLTFPWHARRISCLNGLIFKKFANYFPF